MRAVLQRTHEQPKERAGDSEKSYLVAVVVPEQKALEALARDLGVYGDVPV